MTWNERKFVNDVLAPNVKDVLAQNVNDVMLDRACAPYSLCRFTMGRGLKLYTKICYNSLMLTSYWNKVYSSRRNEGKLWEVLYR